MPKSYFHAPVVSKNRYITFHDQSKNWADEKPDKTAFVLYNSLTDRSYCTRQWCYDMIVKWARVMLKLGLQKGDRVAYCASNTITWFPFDAGIMKAGGVTIHLVYCFSDIKIVIADCNMVILENKRDWEDFTDMATIKPGGKVECDKFPAVRLAISNTREHAPPNALIAEDLIAEIESLDPDSYTNFPFVDPEDVVYMQTTTGSTGPPKKCRHTSFNGLNATCFLLEDADFADNCRFSSRNLSYSSSYPYGYLQQGCVIVNGDPMFLNNHENQDQVVEIWRREGCTIASVGWHNLADLKDYGFKIRLMSSGGDVLTRDHIEHSFVFTERVIMVYYSVEALRIAHRIYTKENVKEYRQGHLGRPSQGTEVKIVNNLGEVVEMGEEGTICMRIPWCCRGYDQERDFTKELSGHVITTDIGYFLPGGDIMLKRRDMDIIMKDNITIPVTMIEGYVKRNKDVVEVIVVGIPDPSCGEDVCACVKLVDGKKFDPEELTEYCQESIYHRFSYEWVPRVPTYWMEFKEYPLGGDDGKTIDRKKVKEIAIERFEREFGSLTN